MCDQLRFLLFRNFVEVKFGCFSLRFNALTFKLFVHFSVLEFINNDE